MDTESAGVGINFSLHYLLQAPVKMGLAVRIFNSSPIELQATICPQPMCRALA